MRRKLGILGGLGPLASAEFLATLYRRNLADPEQGSPVCVMISDPSFPDRTTAILEEDTEELVRRLVRALADLVSLGAEILVIACVTIHHVLDSVPPDLRRRVVSLIDLVLDDVAASPRRLLLLSTSGSRAARIFERHARWPQVADCFVHPGDKDQAHLHALIYRLKQGEISEADIAWLSALPACYGVEGCVFGCTELHLVYRPVIERLGPAGILDPLALFAETCVPA